MKKTESNRKYPCALTIIRLSIVGWNFEAACMCMCSHICASVMKHNIKVHVRLC